MLILASNSPRRKELLKQINCNFISKSSNTDEISPTAALEPQKLVMQNAVLKAKSVANAFLTDTTEKNKNDECTILGADTIVFYNGIIYGKPKNNDDAFQILKNLSGHKHQVYTGIALYRSGKIWQNYAVTDVYMKNLTDEEILSYIKSGEPADKAGAYAIQGRACVFIEKINGCYFNVVGLPLNCLYNLAKKAEINL